MNSTQLLDLIYTLHQGIPDIHLGYQVNGIKKRYSGEIKKDIGISESFQSERIYDRGSFVYFKPAKILMPQLTDSQNSFVELVKKNDRNLVIDLRDVHGGGGPFAEELATNIFSISQKMPQSKKLQVVSGLSYIGLAVTARIAQRAAPYKSKIILLVDGACASECETIVELLSAHPNVSLVGQNTRGALHFSNAISFILPNSGIWVRIPSLTQILKNDAIEGVGYAPTVVSDFIDLNKLVFW